MAYHKALSLQPSFSFCSDLLNSAMEDSRKYSGHFSHDDPYQNPIEVFDESQYVNDEEQILFSTNMSFQSSGVESQQMDSSINDNFEGCHMDLDSSIPRFNLSSRSQGDDDVDFSGSVESYSRVAGRLSLDSQMS
jgi:hypothetical protein